MVFLFPRFACIFYGNCRDQVDPEAGGGNWKSTTSHEYNEDFESNENKNELANIFRCHKSRNSPEYGVYLQAQGVLQRN